MKSTVVRGLVICLLTAGCSGLGTGSPAPSRAGASPGPLITVFAAASLKAVLDEAAVEYQVAIPRITLVITTDSSTALETQIEQGAPADVFLSADTTNPQKLVDGGFAQGASVAFAGNKLTIVVPTDNPVEIESWQDLAEDGLKVIAAGEEVPITKYATQLVDNLAAASDAPAGFAAGYAANIVSREENVKALIAKIELGEGDAGIVYVTDAAASTKVQTIDVPDDANVPATYAGVVVKTTHDVSAAQAFLDWFAGPDGQAILAEFGFLPPPAGARSPAPQRSPRLVRAFPVK